MRGVLTTIPHTYNRRVTIKHRLNCTFILYCKGLVSIDNNVRKAIMSYFQHYKSGFLEGLRTNTKNMKMYMNDRQAYIHMLPIYAYRD